ncbi:MAG TPA: amidohydrolase family protein [Acidisoma sp.]|uniref:amidohydrolase family protein n=1 Tax=Acidisoma sp. TaxID=1872115 RepID=UPI002C28C810|nr:amidohydrolase family protein [Acidisoma sp.]HTI02302.1 amidohydrolase family protein [Acidisoma sp.]
MTLDLIIRDAILPDGRTGQDIGVAGGRIVAVEPKLAAEAREELAAGGHLLSPPFVDPHFHMDATLSLGIPRVNRSGTLLEGIALWGELKPMLTHEAVVERALRYCDLAVSHGLLAIRSHVDISDPRLVTVDALLDVRERVKSYIDLQLVAFPQDGYYRSPGAVDLLERALDKGIEIVGGIPHFERTMEAGRQSVEALFRIAADRGLRIDIHCDETDDPLSRHVETMASEALRFGLADRATASHTTSMHSMDNYYAAKLIALIAESGMNIIANPLINITLQGRMETYPKRRGLTRVPELLAAGVNVAFGQDCTMDPWYSLGSGDMLEVAHMGLHVAQMTSQEAQRTCFEAVTTHGAQVMGLEGYGIAPGCRADFVLLQAKSPSEAIRLRATRLVVVRSGRVIARTPAREASLFLDGRPPMVDAAAYAPKLG